MRPRLSRRNAEAFARAVDGRVQRRAGPPFDDHLRELVDVAGFIRASSAPTARRDFVTGLRAELMAAAQEELSESTVAPSRDRLVVSPPRLRRRLTAAASAFVVVGGTLGLVAASAQAVPGDMLYPVKRATEKFELMLRDGAAEGRALLEHAQTRLGEIESLTADPGRGDADELIAQTLADFTADASAGGALLLEAYSDDSAAGHIDALRAFTADSAQRLRDLAGALPDSSATEYADATETVGGLDASAYQACPTCAGGEPTLPVASDLLADVAYVLDSDRPSSRSDPSIPGPIGEDRAGDGRPLADLELPVVTNDSQDQPSGDTDGTNDEVELGEDDPTSDPVDPVEDVTEGVEESTENTPVEDVSGPVQDLVEPLAETVDGLLGDALGTN